MLNPNSARYDDSLPEHGQAYNSPPETNTLPSIDFYGAVIRRKFVIILLGLFGAGIAYLLYSRAVPVYASSLRLMIWVQSPPTIVNGEVVAQTVSIPKQQTFITSHLVLNEAIKKGNLEKLDSFASSPYPLGQLQKMLKVAPVDKNTDALELTLTGEVASELPTILNEVVQAYEGAIKDDTFKAGKESVVLIESLQQRLEDDQKLDQSKYYELLNKLKLTSENEAGKWVNPFLADVQRLKQERDTASKNIEEMDEKLKSVKAAFEPKNESGLIKRLMSIEAKNALKLNEETSVGGMELLTVEERATYSKLQSRLDMMEGKIFELETQRDDLLRQFGPRHQTIASLESTLQAYIAKRSATETEIAALSSSFESKQIEARKIEGESQDVKKKEFDLLVLYGMKLTSDIATQKKLFDKVVTEIGKLEEESKIIAADMAEVNMLKAQINERRDSVAKILDKLSAINVLSNNYTTTKVRVINPPAGARQVAPNILTYLSIGIIAASLIGVGLAVLIDQSDLAYRTPIDIQHSLSVPVICKIPKIKLSKTIAGQTGAPILITAFNPQSPASETFRAARTALLFSAHQINGKVFLFTSPSPGDGKSTTAANLAVSLAQAKKRVVLVDADFRRPRVQQNFGIEIAPGSTDVLSGEVSLEKAIRPCDFQTNLSLLTTGGRPSDAGELVASSGFASIIDQLRERFDIVIIDSPPILPVADSTSLSSVVDGIFLVLRIRKGVMLAAHKAKERLDMVQGKVLGVIVNGMDENVYYSEYGMYYRGAYYSGYGRYYDSQNASYTDRSAKEAKKSSKISETSDAV